MNMTGKILAASWIRVEPTAAGDIGRVQACNASMRTPYDGTVGLLVAYTGRSPLAASKSDFSVFV